MSDFVVLLGIYIILHTGARPNEAAYIIHSNSF